MKKIALLKIAALVFSASLIAACASPAPVRKLADQGAGTVGMAEVSLREYLNSTGAQLAARTDLVRLEAQQRIRDRSRRELDAALDQSTGVNPSENTAVLIRDLGDKRKRSREQELAELEKAGLENTFDIKQVSAVPTAKLTLAKNGFAVLAQELSAKEWLILSAGYAREIFDGINSLKKADANAPITGGQ